MCRYVKNCCSGGNNHNAANLFSSSHRLQPLLASYARSVPALLLLGFISFFFLFVTSSLVTWDEIEGQSRGVGHEMAETVCQWELGRMDEPELGGAAEGRQLCATGCFTPSWLAGHWPEVGLSVESIPERRSVPIGPNPSSLPPGCQLLASTCLH